MSQSKIESLRSSYRKSAVRQVLVAAYAGNAAQH